MTLNDYRNKKGWSLSELARKLGAPHATVVRRWCLPFGDQRRLIPNINYMLRIVEVSAGEVMPNDFYLRRD